jgi:hypothetical protein
MRHLIQLREDHLLHAHALSLALEREVEMVCGGSLDQEDWLLNLDEGRLERSVLVEESGDGPANGE